MPKVNLRSADDQVYEVEVEVAVKSKKIQEVLKPLGKWNEGNEPTIFLPNIQGNVLIRVIKWIDKHKHDAPTIPEEEEQQNPPWSYLYSRVSNWDKIFFDTGEKHNEFFDLVSAAQYLVIESMECACFRYACDMMKGKEVDDIRELFNISNNHTPGELDLIRAEIDWCSVREIDER